MVKNTEEPSYHHGLKIWFPERGRAHAEVKSRAARIDGWFVVGQVGNLRRVENPPLVPGLEGNPNRRAGCHPNAT